MAKLKTVFICQNCGAQSPKWVGRCASCGEWNTYVEEVVKKDEQLKKWEKLSVNSSNSQVFSIIDIATSGEIRINTLNNEFNRVLGGGLVNGSLVLIGGEPGIGKSTLLLQIALHLKDVKTLYVSGEESLGQIKMRADRLGAKNPSCFILTETAIPNILQHIEEVNPQLVVIDSVQTLYTPVIESSVGSIAQIRECASQLQKYAKTNNVPVVLIGHITKEGVIAGPKVLEHMVDTVLQFEGERNYGYRILRATKNRFGSTSELGIYEMHNAGLKEINNPSEILISHHDELLSGIAISCTLEGMRPLLVETQALVSSSVYHTPQRTATGFDLRRLAMLLAVLEKRCGFKLSSKDVFLNITGGIKIDDPAIDLGIVCSILSSNEDIPIPGKICFTGEVGLSGEIRPVNRIEQRIGEAEKLGFEKIIVSKFNIKGLNLKKYQSEIIGIGKVEEALKHLFH